MTTTRDKQAYCWLCGARVYGATEIYCRECRRQEDADEDEAKPAATQSKFPAWPERQLKLFE